MTATMRAELFKQRSTRTSMGLFTTMIGLVLFVVSLHGFGVGARSFDRPSAQLTNLFGWGEVFGALFAALVGAMSMTGEVRHGTIRPTFLVTPQRRRVVVAKACVCLIIGAGFGLAAGAVATFGGIVALRARSIDVLPDIGDFTLLVAGGAVAAALSAVIGVGVGAIVRNQVPALVGIVVWLLFIENLLVGDLAGVGDVGRLLPGAAGRAISGQDPDELLAPGLGLGLLVLYAAISATAGSLATTRRDFA